MNAPKPPKTLSVRAADQPRQRGTHGTIVVRTKSSSGRIDLRTRGPMRLSGRRTAGTELRNHSAKLKRVIETRLWRGSETRGLEVARFGGAEAVVGLGVGSVAAPPALPVVGEAGLRGSGEGVSGRAASGG